MTEPRRLTREQIDAAIEKIDALPIKARSSRLNKLAREAGVSRQTLRWHCLRAGVRLSARLLGPVDGQPYLRNGHLVRRFTAEEDALVKELDQQGLGPKAIGDRLGRRCNTIIGRLATLASYEAQEDA